MLLNPFAVRVSFVAAACTLLALAGPAGAEMSWRVAEPRDGDPEGYTLYVEETDARYPGYKAEGWLDADPQEAAASIMVQMTHDEFVPKGQTRRILRSADDEVVLHTFIDMPIMVADRDLTLRITQNEDPETGVVRVEWQSAEAEAPAPGGEVVRISEARGYWELVPAAPGRTRATYMTRADLGGWLPARLVSPLMRDQVAGDVSRLQHSLRKFTVSAGPGD